MKYCNLSLWKKLIIFSVLGFICSSCSHEELVVPSSPPPFVLYKTSGDYFDFMNVNLNENNRSRYIYNISEDEVKKYSFLENSGYHLRVALDSGYFLAWEITVDDYFTDLTFAEYRDLCHSTIIDGVKLDSIISSHIVDRDPFTEFYLIDYEEVIQDSLISEFSEFNTSEASFRMLLRASDKINKRISEDALGQYYFKVK